jgi:4-amino-4-deoxy-L-arabinose transferase-like glycosyltransferase
MNFLQRNKKWLTAVLAAVILGIMFGTLVSLARHDSGTTDEVAHIPSGFSYINAMDYRLNPEHPPLAKALAGIPLQFLHLKTFYEKPSWLAINQWEAGWDFIYRMGNNADQILFWARLPIILLTISLGLILFFWVKSLYGRKVALLILLLYAFSPEFLGNGHLVTTDVAAALGFVIAVWSYVRFLKKQTWWNLILAGVLFGVAQTLKFSSFLLIPILFLILVGWVVIFRENQGFWKVFWPNFIKSLEVLLVGFLVVWAIYMPFTWNMSGSTEHAVIENNLTNNNQTVLLRSFVHHFEGNKITRPVGHYILGLFLNFGRVGGGNSTYIMGHFSDKGIKWYFPAAWMVKIPLAIDALVVLGLYLLIRYGFESKEDKWRLYYLTVPIVLYWAVTLAGSLNIGIRHLMPTLPFVYLFIAWTLSVIFSKKDNKLSDISQSVFKIFVWLLLSWYVLASILTYPFYMAYFNELTWGQAKYKYLVDSNLDWGQDLKRLSNFINDNQIDKIHIDYFGGSVPDYYINPNKIIAWHSDQGPATGWFAISAEYFQFSKFAGVKEGKWDYSWLEQFPPVTIIGDSILVFNISEEDLLNHPPKPLAPVIKITPQEAEAQRIPKTVPSVAN